MPITGFHMLKTDRVYADGDTIYVSSADHTGCYQFLHTPSPAVARAMADAFNAAMEAERKPVAAE